MKKLTFIALTTLLISATSQAGRDDLQGQSGAPYTECNGVCEANKKGGTTWDHQKKQYCELNVECSPGANNSNANSATGADDAKDSK